MAECKKIRSVGRNSKEKGGGREGTGRNDGGENWEERMCGCRWRNRGREPKGRGRWGGKGGEGKACRKDMGSEVGGEGWERK